MAPALLLFDLDGTLIDSAPDLAGATNDMRLARGMTEMPFVELRAMVGTGARGMIATAFDVQPGQAEFAELRDEFLRRYEERMTRLTVVFEEVTALLDELDDRDIRWGIVTNKAMRFAAPLAGALGLASRAAVLVAGDTTAHAKPHPAPLIEAASRAGVAPGACVYIGDDLRDVQAGRAAGMTTVAVQWGYLGCGPGIFEWGADHVVASTSELLKALALA